MTLEILKAQKLTGSARAEFVLEHTEARVSAFLPEYVLREASDVTPLWYKSAETFGPTLADPPFWAFAWPGGVALSRFILDNAETVANLSVLDVATGGGVIAIACARAGARIVTAIDSDPLAIAACRINVHAAKVTVVAEEQTVGPAYAPECDLVVAGDVFYDRDMSAVFFEFLRAARARGARVLVGDPGRSYAPTSDVRELATYEVPTLAEVEGVETKEVRILELL